MRHLAPPLLAAAALLGLVILTSSVVSAQAGKPIEIHNFSPRMNTVVDNIVGLGESAPQARIIFHIEEDDLCLFIAIPPDPKQLQAELFRFKRRYEGEHKLETLKFKLPKKPAKRESDGVRVWESCLEDIAAVQANVTELGGSFIEITYRDPRAFAKPVEATLNHPLGILPIGVDVHKDSAGGLHFSRYDPSDDLAEKDAG